jgi:hypothetical protein
VAQATSLAYWFFKSFAFAAPAPTAEGLHECLFCQLHNSLLKLTPHYRQKAIQVHHNNFADVDGIYGYVYYFCSP